MKLDLTHEQELVRDTTKRFLADQCPVTAVRALADSALGYDRQWWRRGAELGWTAMLVPEEHGGGSPSGDGLLDLVVVAEEMGRMVSPGPLVPINVVAAALARAGSHEQRRALLPGLAAGETAAAWCLAEDDKWDARGGECGARREGDGYVLQGRKSPVEAAVGADHLLVSIRTDGGGSTQFVVPADAPGISIRPLRSLDLVRRFAEVRFDAVAVPSSAVVGAAGGADADIEHQLQVAVVLQCAETVGAVDRTLAFTIDYAFQRFSFGRPLASYQALKHRFADAKMWSEASLATAAAAAAAVNAGTADAAELVSVAAAYIGDRSTAIIQDCVQLHGGIGVTWEHDIHLYLRRAAVNAAVYGTPQQHRERIATLLAV